MPADNPSLDIYSGTDFPLLPTQYGGLGGVLFDDGRKDIALDVTVNLIFLSSFYQIFPVGVASSKLLDLMFVD